MTPDQEQADAHWKEQYEAARRRAFEKHVLELIRSTAPIQEAAELDLAGTTANPTVRGVDLVGEYPETHIEIRTFDRGRDLEQSHKYPIWDGTFGSDDKMRPPEYIAQEMLMWARGG